MTTTPVEQPLPGMPELPPPAYPTHVEEVTADRLARHHTAVAVTLSGQMIDHPWMALTYTEPPTEEYLAGRTAWLQLLRDFGGEYRAATLLRALQRADPAGADEMARRMWSALHDGQTAAEQVFEWLVHYGITLPNQPKES